MNHFREWLVDIVQEGILRAFRQRDLMQVEEQRKWDEAHAELLKAMYEQRNKIGPNYRSN